MNTIGLVALIALSLGLVIGPILALQPSPRDRQLARLRVCAVAQGLRVRLSGARPQRVEYILPWELRDLEYLRANAFAQFERRGEQWSDHAASPRPFAAQMQLEMQRMPAGVSAVGGDAEGIAACWNERGDDVHVEAIASVLKALRVAWRQGLGI